MIHLNEFFFRCSLQLFFEPMKEFDVDYPLTKGTKLFGMEKVQNIKKPVLL